MKVYYKTVRKPCLRGRKKHYYYGGVKSYYRECIWCHKPEWYIIGIRQAQKKWR